MGDTVAHIDVLSESSGHLVEIVVGDGMLLLSLVYSILQSLLENFFSKTLARKV